MTKKTNSITRKLLIVHRSIDKHGEAWEIMLSLCFLHAFWRIARLLAGRRWSRKSQTVSHVNYELIIEASTSMAKHGKPCFPYGFCMLFEGWRACVLVEDDQDKSNSVTRKLWIDHRSIDKHGKAWGTMLFLWFLHAFWGVVRLLAGRRCSSTSVTASRVIY